MPADHFRKRRLLHPKPMVSTVISRPRPDALKIRAVTLGNMRANGVQSLGVQCSQCHRLIVKSGRSGKVAA